MGLPFFHGNGVRITTGSIYCFDENSNPLSDVQVFDTATGKWSKTFTCYDTTL